MAANLALQEIGAIVAVIAAVVAAVYIGKKRNGSRMPMPPGPRRWPIVGNLGLLGELAHQDFAKLAKQYGPFMLLHLGSVPVVIVSSSRFAELILKTHDKVFASRPFLSQSKILGYDATTLFFSPYGSYWRRIRKVVLELFTAKRIRQFQTVRREEVLCTLHSILDESKAGRAIPLDVKFQSVTTDVTARMMIGKTFFGPNSSAMTSNFRQQRAEQMEILKEVVRLEGAFVLGDYIPLLKNFDPQGFKKEMQAVHGKSDEILDGIFQGRRESLLLPPEGFPPGKSGVLNVVDALLTRPHSVNEKPLTDTEMKGILQDLWVGGIDTASNTLEWTIAELLRNPILLKRTQEELDKVVGQDRLVEESDIPHLHYLHAVVKESCRLHPVVPILVRESMEACEVGGYYIPMKTAVLINVWAIGRDPGVWDRPWEFCPDRFLRKNSAMDGVRQEFELLPFGAGRRICPGRSLGLLTVQYTLAVLLHACSWSLPQGMAPENVLLNEAPGMTLPMASRVEAVATPRLPHSVIYAR